MLRGVVRSGRREAAGFTSIPWVAEKLAGVIGNDLHPGTLNLHLEDPRSRRAWAALREGGRGEVLSPEEAGFCAATCFPVVIADEVAGAVVLPDVDAYPDELVEVIAAENLRERLALSDGDTCEIRFLERRGPRFGVVLFDLEGTLVDFQWRLEEAEADLREALGEMGFEPALFAGQDYAGIRRAALEAVEDEGPRTEVVRRLAPVYDRYDLDALSRWSLREGARRLFGDLRSQGVKLGLVTNIGRRAVGGALEKFGLAGEFEAVVTRDDVLWMKPDGEGILCALDGLGGDVADALMVGDSLSDLRAARHAGVPVVLVQGGESTIRSLGGEAPDVTARSLGEVRELVLGETEPCPRLTQNRPRSRS